VFPAFFISAVALAHLYVVQRLAIAPAWPTWVEALLTTVAVAGFGSVVLVMLPLPRRGSLSRLLFWTENVWLGFVLLLMLATLASDGLHALAIVIAPAGWMNGDASQIRAWAVLIVALLAAARALHGGLRSPATQRIDVHLDRWPAHLDGFRIVQISDLHIGPIHRRRFAKEIADRVNALLPDLVAMTGDLVDGKVEDIGREVEPLGALSARYGVYFITGNHDVYSGADAWVSRCEELGWRALRNDRVFIAAGGPGFYLAGVDDEFGALVDPNEALERALAGRDPDRALVLLAHRPRVFQRASELGVDLQLSGHTHGGQIWPGGWFARLRDRWIAGPHRLRESQLYVSRGTGSFGPPMRLGSPAEITELVLRSSDRSQGDRPVSVPDLSNAPIHRGEVPRRPRAGVESDGEPAEGQRQRDHTAACRRGASFPKDPVPVQDLVHRSATMRCTRARGGHFVNSRGSASPYTTNA